MSTSGKGKPFDWEFFKPSRLAHHRSSTSLREMAGWHAQGKFDIHSYGHEIVKSPNQAFHPFWYELSHEDTQAHYFVEKELFKDALDAVCHLRIVIPMALTVCACQITTYDVTSRNTLDRADSSRAVHVTSRTRHRLPTAPSHLGPVPCAWNLSLRFVSLFGPFTCICFLSHFVSI